MLRPHGTGYIRVPDFDRERFWLNVLWYLERALTFLLGLVLVVGLITQAFRTFTITRAEYNHHHKVGRK